MKRNNTRERERGRAREREERERGGGGGGGRGQKEIYTYSAHKTMCDFLSVIFFFFFFLASLLFTNGDTKTMEMIKKGKKNEIAHNKRL